MQACLAKRPEQRPQAASEIASRLRISKRPPTAVPAGFALPDLSREAELDHTETMAIPPWRRPAQVPPVSGSVEPPPAPASVAASEPEAEQVWRRRSLESANDASEIEPPVASPALEESPGAHAAAVTPAPDQDGVEGNSSEAPPSASIQDATSKSPERSPGKRGVDGVGVTAAAVILIGAAIFFPSASDPAVQTPPAPARVVSNPDRVLTLIALDVVHVTVARKNSDGSEGGELFKGILQRGERKDLSKPGPIYISTTQAENLKVGFLGKEYPLILDGQPARGVQRFQMD